MVYILACVIFKVYTWQVKKRTKYDQQDDQNHEEIMKLNVNQNILKLKKDKN